MSPEQLTVISNKLGQRFVTQFVAYAKNPKDTREKVESFRTYAAVLLHKLLSRQESMHKTATENELIPTLLSLVSESEALDDIFQLSLRMIYTLASSPHQPAQQALLDAKCLAAVAPLRKVKEGDIGVLTNAICNNLLAAHKKTVPPPCN